MFITVEVGSLSRHSLRLTSRTNVRINLETDWSKSRPMDDLAHIRYMSEGKPLEYSWTMVYPPRLRGAYHDVDLLHDLKLDRPCNTF